MNNKKTKKCWTYNSTHEGVGNGKIIIINNEKLKAWQWSFILNIIDTLGGMQVVIMLKVTTFQFEKTKQSNWFDKKG